MSSITSKTKTIQIDLENFAQEKYIEDTNSLVFDDVDLARRLSERPAIIDNVSIIYNEDI